MCLRKIICFFILIFVFISLRIQAHDSYDHEHGSYPGMASEMSGQSMGILDVNHPVIPLNRSRLPYYIFDTHLHNVAGFDPVIGDYPGTTCVLAEYGSMNSHAHKANLQSVYNHILFPTPRPGLTRGSIIKRALVVGGDPARSPGWEASGCETYFMTPTPACPGTSLVDFHPYSSDSPDDLKFGAVSELNAEWDQEYLFANLIGFSPSRCAITPSFRDSRNFLDDKFDQGYRWIGEKLGDPCWRDRNLVGFDLNHCDYPTNDLTGLMRQIFLQCAARNIPISTHLPFVSPGIWMEFLTSEPPYQCPDSEETDGYNPCEQFINVLDAAAEYGTVIHYNMAGSQFFPDPGYIDVMVDTYTYIFETYPDFYIELYKVHGPYLYDKSSREKYLASDNYNACWIRQTFYNDPDNPESGFRPDTERLLTLFATYPRQFTICSHLYPQYNFSPNYQFGPIWGEWEQSPFQVENTVFQDVSIRHHHTLAVGDFSSQYQTPVFIRDNDTGAWSPFDWPIQFGSVNLKGMWVFDTGRSYEPNYVMFAVGVDASQTHLGKIFMYQSETDEWSHVYSTPGSVSRGLNAVWGFEKSGNPTDPWRMYACGENGTVVAFTANGGSMRTDIPTSEKLNDIFGNFRNNEKIFCVGDHGVVLEYKGSLDVWQRHELGIRTNLNAVYGKYKKFYDQWAWLFIAGNSVDGGSEGHIPTIFFGLQDGNQTDRIAFQQFPQHAFPTAALNAHMRDIRGFENGEIYFAGTNNIILRLRDFYDDLSQTEPFELMTCSGTPVDFTAIAGVNSFRMAAVGTTEGTGHMSAFQGRRSMEWFNAYWETFFEVLTDYADRMPPEDQRYTGDEIQALMSHCNVERLLGIAPLDGYSCPVGTNGRIEEPPTQKPKGKQVSKLRRVKKEE